MSKRLLLSIAVLAAGISACNDSALPTDAGRDLLKDPSGAPLLGNSLYGEALVTDSASTTLPDTIVRVIPVWPIEQIGGTPPGHEHIEAAPDITKYKPIGYEHITSGRFVSRYKPEDNSVHQIGANNPEFSQYAPPGYVHITSGSNKSKYYKPGTTPPVTPTPPTLPDTITRVIPVWPIEQIGGTPTGHEHIEAEPDITKYKPIGYDHITSGEYRSRYKPEDNSVHQIGANNPEFSQYAPPGYVHITSGSNKSKYYKPPTPADTTTPTNPPTNPPTPPGGGGSSD